MENIGISVISFALGLLSFNILKGMTFKEESFSYIMILFFSSLCWTALFTGGNTGLVGYINIIILIVGMAIIHFINSFFT